MKTIQTAAAPTTGRRDFLRWSVGAGASVALGATGPALAQRARVLRFGSPQPVESTYHEAMMMFASEVAKLSSNKMKVETFPNSQLGSIKEMLSAVQLGTLSMSIAVPAWYSNFVKQMDVFTLPYMIYSPQRLRQGLDGAFGERMATYADAAGFKMLGCWLMGSRHMVNNVHPINKPADMVGLKMRVISSPVYIETFRALGANPVALDSAEIYLAMQQHVVDGLEYPLPDLISAKIYEVAKYVSLDAHTTDFFIVSMNNKVWSGLSPDEKGVVTQAMKTATDWQWKAQPEAIAAAATKLKTLMTINDIAPAERQKFADITRPIYKQFEPSIGAELMAQAIQAFGPG
jgi:tripartite ATP-independent transporter DctP family solute receptor